MTPSRTKQSRKARRVRRTYLLIALAHAAGEATDAQLAKAQANVEALDLIGWETRAEGFTGADEEDEADGEEEAPKPKKAKQAKKLTQGKKARRAHADIPVTMATAGAR